VVAAATMARLRHCGLRALLFAQGYSASQLIPSLTHLPHASN